MLGMMVFIVSGVKLSILKCFRSIELDLRSFDLWLENWI